MKKVLLLTSSEQFRKDYIFLTPGSYKSSDEPCGLFVYGWEQDVSYAYPGGLNLEKLDSN
ncbi:MAG TPA: hypothetical protein PLX56_11530 [bacterium]|nr:hypothetical protein [bacterium]